MKNNLHFFIVDANVQKNKDLTAALQSHFQHLQISFLTDFNKVVDSSIDCLIVVLPSKHYFKTLEELSNFKQKYPNILVIGFSETQDTSLIVATIKVGADDFVVNNQLNQLPSIIEKQRSGLVLRKEQQILEESLQHIAKALNSNDRNNFFNFCTTEIERTIQADYVFISLVNEQNPLKLDVVSLAHENNILPNFSYEKKGSPCEEAMAYASCLYTKNVAATFKEDILLAEMQIEGYIGVALTNNNKQHLGVLAALFKKPIEQTDLTLNLLQLYATFIIGELERAASEKALLESEHNLNKAQELAKLGSWEFNLTTYDLKWSKQLFKIFGISEETPNNELFEAYSKKLHPNDLQQIHAFVAKKENYKFEHIIIDENGNEKYITSIGLFTFDENGNAIKLSGTAQDITERKKIELELKHSEDKFRSLVYNISDIITLINEQGKIIYQSSSVKQIMGYSENELTGKNIFELIHPQDKDKVAAVFFEAIHNEGSSKSVEFRFLDKKNNYLFLEAQGNNQLNNPAIQAMIINSRDISERKKIENAIIAKTKLLEAIAVASNFMLQTDNWNELISKTLETVGKAVDADRMYYFENSVDENTGLETTSQQIEWTKNNISPQINNPELQNIPFGSLQDFFDKLQQNKPFCTLVSKLPDTSTTKPLLESQEILSILVLPLFVNKQFKGFLGFDDCTSERIWSNDEISILQTLCSNLATAIEKRQIEAAILASNERFEFVTQATSDAIWDKNLITKKTYWSNNYEQLFGHVLTNTDADFYNFEKCIHPDDKAHIFKTIEQFFNYSKEHKITLEYRFKKSNGEYAVVRDQSIVIRNKKGKAIRAIGAMQDITQKKQEELQLKLFESAIKNAHDCVLITEAEPISGEGPKIVYVNEAFTTLTGYTSEEVLGKTPRILQGSKTDRTELDKLRESLLQWRPHRFEILNYKKNGEEFFQEISIFPIADENGWFTHWISVQKNITERKKAEIEKEVFYEILTAINRNKTIDEGLQQILKITCQYLDFAYAEAWTVNIDKAKLKYRTNWKANEIAGYLRGATSITEAQKGDKLVGTTWQIAQKTYWEDLQNSPLHSKDYATLANLTSGMGLPIMFNNEVVAILTFFNHQPFTKEQINNGLLEKISSQIGTDIERKRTEDELNKFFSLSPDMLCIVGYDGFFKKVNKATSTLLEYTEEELLHQPVDHFIHPDYLLSTQEKRTLLKQGFPLINFENIYVTKSKKNKWLAWTSIPIKEEGIIYAVAKDITEKRKMDEEKKQLIEELTRNNTELKQFSYITSHNMRAPLTNLLSIVNLLNTNTISDERTLKLINGFKTSTYQLNETLNDLINVLIIKEKTNYDLVPINLKEAVEKVISSISSMITKADIEINYNFDLAENVLFSEQYIESIFLNLITNSIKYAHPNRKGVINIHSYSKNNHIHIDFSDNGIGIDMNKAKNKIFGFHQKFHNHPESKGIGLYIVHAQMTALGGEISVESKENEGTTFTLTFKK